MGSEGSDLTADRRTEGRWLGGIAGASFAVAAPLTLLDALNLTGPALVPWWSFWLRGWLGSMPPSGGEPLAK